MKHDLYTILFFIGVEFLLYRFVLVVLGLLFTKLLKKDTHIYHKQEMTASILLYLVFTFVYFKTLVIMIPSLYDAYLDVYILLVIYGCFSVFWAYFSWDMDHLFRPITFALNKDVIIKKGIIYFIVLVGALVLGVHQTKQFVGIGSVEPLYSIANISILTVIIALDRVMNQIFLTYLRKHPEK